MTDLLLSLAKLRLLEPLRKPIGSRNTIQNVGARLRLEALTLNDGVEKMSGRSQHVSAEERKPGLGSSNGFEKEET